jgi:AcrR family transcriptional regulator
MNETTTKTKRQIQKEQTRLLIVETATQLYGQNGLLATTTEEVARAAGISHGTIFLHFPTQGALINAVIEAFGAQVTRRMHELAAGEKSLREVLAAHLQALEEFEPFYKRLVIESRLLPPGAREVFTLIQSTISYHIGLAAEREMRAGAIASYPIHLLFNTWAGLIHYYLANDDLFAPNGSILERYGPEILTYYLQLIASKKGE